MAERSTWKGSIGFGMVNIPVKLYTATEEKNISFNSIHRTCGERIKMPKWCDKCGKKVEQADIVKGYPVGEQYVLLEENELKSLPVKSSQNIEVLALVPDTAIDPRFPMKSYFLSPDKAGIKAFSLFMQAMAKVGKVAVAKIALRERERMVAIRPFGNLMLVQTLWWSDELKDSSKVECALPEVSTKEMDLATQLLNTLSLQFDFTAHKDEYREVLMDIINAKVAGEEYTVAPQEEKKEELDLVDALIASLGEEPPAPDPESAPEPEQVEEKTEDPEDSQTFLIPSLKDRLAAIEGGKK